MDRQIIGTITVGVALAGLIVHGNHSLKVDLGGRIERVEQQLTDRIDRLADRIGKVEQRVGKVESQIEYLSGMVSIGAGSLKGLPMSKDYETQPGNVEDMPVPEAGIAATP